MKKEKTNLQLDYMEVARKTTILLIPCKLNIHSENDGLGKVCPFKRLILSGFLFILNVDVLVLLHLQAILLLTQATANLQTFGEYYHGWSTYPP